LQYYFRRENLSLIAGVTWWNLYFQIFPGTIKAPRMIEFLAPLQSDLPGPLLLIGRGCAAIAAGHARLRRRPEGSPDARAAAGYAPELNPIQYIWGHLEHNEIWNLCPRDLWQFSAAARAALRGMHRHPRLVGAFWKEPDLRLSTAHRLSGKS
jgi:hypothetical protein